MPARKKSRTPTSASRAKRFASPRTQLSYETQTILVVFLLFVFYPVGIILMWLWMKWPVWVKLLAMLPFLCALFALSVMVFFIGIATRSSIAEQDRMMRIQQQLQQLSPSPEMTITPSPTYTMPAY